MRLEPNNISELTQSPSTNIGRYTFMGDLNQFVNFQQPAHPVTSCLKGRTTAAPKAQPWSLGEHLS